MPSVPLIHAKLRELREERGYSRSALSRATVTDGFAGIPESTIEALEKRPGQVPKAWIIEALAAALDVQPDAFYEWPIAVAQQKRTTARNPVEIARQAAQRREGTR